MHNKTISPYLPKMIIKYIFGKWVGTAKLSGAFKKIMRFKTCGMYLISMI